MNRKNKLYIGMGVLVLAGVLILVLVGSNEVVSSSGEVKEFDIVSSDWEFSPSRIVVQKGDLVKLNIDNIEGSHGIAIKEFGVSEFFGPGDKVEIEFVADKVGEFYFYCNMYCGSGHGSMSGVLVVN